jgi:RNA polymerase sigma-70 factor (ECF subfamily)
MDMEGPMRQGEEHEADRLLVQAVARGEPDALVELMRRNGGWVRGVVFAACGDAELVDDVQQQVWLSAWRRAGSLSDASKWRGWLYALAYHAGIDTARRAGRRQRLLRRLLRRLPLRQADEPEASRRLILQESHRQALKAVGELPEMYRGPFVLRHLADWSYRQIAEAMDLPVETVETRLVRARRMLREKLTRGAES